MFAAAVTAARLPMLVRVWGVSAEPKGVWDAVASGGEKKRMRVRQARWSPWRASAANTRAAGRAWRRCGRLGGQQSVKARARRGQSMSLPEEVLAGVGQEARAARERAVGAETSMGVAASSTTTVSLGAVLVESASRLKQRCRARDTADTSLSLKETHGGECVWHARPWQRTAPAAGGPKLDCRERGRLCPLCPLPVSDARLNQRDARLKHPCLAAKPTNHRRRPTAPATTTVRAKLAIFAPEF
ncbi:hypothetical protein PSPO01_13076 [Paraphaeosphaeria sporulosa]